MLKKIIKIYRFIKNKFITTFNQFQRKVKIALSSYDKNKTNQIEQEKFKSLFCSRDKALTLLNSILSDSPHQSLFDIDTASIHWVLFAAISIKYNMQIKNILEIGTHNGDGTYILSKLFPHAKIVTIDLPESDPILRSTYSRDDPIYFKKFKNRQQLNLKNKNINFIQKNSLFLLDNVNIKFDLIWVDGGHHYPEIAWDICNTYHLSNKNGIILYDDVLLNKKSKSNKFVSVQLQNVLSYLNDRIDSEIKFFLKRLGKEASSISKERKYIGVLIK